MRRNLITAILYTLITTVIFGLAYPFVVTGIAQVFFKDKANGQLLQRNGQLIGSRIIGQPFTAAGYFHSRPSAAGNGYDAANSSGSNYAPTNKKLIDRVAGDVSALLRRNLWIYGLGGLIIPFIGIKLIDLIVMNIPGIG